MAADFLQYSLMTGWLRDEMIMWRLDHVTSWLVALSNQYFDYDFDKSANLMVLLTEYGEESQKPII